jgi:hypothetical protein
LFYGIHSVVAAAAASGSFTSPGTMCYTYASCVALLKAGKKINYSGATGPEDFNSYHNTFSGFAVSGFTPADQLTQRAYVSPAQVQANAG